MAKKLEKPNQQATQKSVAIRVNNLGGVLKDLGDLAGAIAAFERALVFFEKFQPPDHPNIKIVRNNLNRV